jgi:hypothetical protein
LLVMKTLCHLMVLIPTLCHLFIMDFGMILFVGVWCK